MGEKKETKGFQIYGNPWYLAIGAAVIILAAAYTGVLGTDFASSMALTMAYGILFYELGERLPIWNTYIGGGILACFFGAAILLQLKLIPDVYVESVNNFIGGDMDFLTLFIIILITGSVLSLEKDILLKSFVGYLPALLGGLIASMLFGVLGGLVFGIDPSTVILKYVLPIMGGGNGAGAVPLSQIYERTTEDPASNFYAFAIIILTIANIISIIAGGLLNKLGMVKPSLTGDGKTLMRNQQVLARDDEKIEPTIVDMGAALVLALACYGTGQLIAGKLLPTIFGASIHEFAYMILIVIILAGTGVVPARIRAGAKQLQKFMTSAGSIILMTGLGFDFDIGELAAACTVSNVIIALLVVIGAIVGAGGIGYLVGFYPIDSAVTAGLCMANRGGNGDVAVLGAARRMDLMAYAQLSSRLGGGIVLIVASFLFSFLLK